MIETTTTPREVTEFSLQRVECPKCGAVWLNGKHTWSGTGKFGNELDLAGLVCNKYGDNACINPLRGAEGGDTWEKRLNILENMSDNDQFK
jgi:hypothetical protein